jgi:uncharacterized protein
VSGDIDRVGPTRRPARAPQGLQRWDRLLFSHWVVPERVLRPLVPPRLTLDAFEGRCFVGLVAFTMKNVRPLRRLPPFPSADDFGEINVRTYVHLNGEEPGVWFFSLDAGSSLVVAAARAIWHLPYFRASFARADDGEHVHWRSQRRWPSPAAELFDADFRVGAALPPAAVGSLEHFLAERYQFYARRGGDLLRARVHHPPYPLAQAHVEQLTPTLLTAAGLPHEGERLPDLFSPGVDVEVYAPELVA